MFCREIGRPKMAKFKIYFKFESCRASGGLAVCVPSLCPCLLSAFLLCSRRTDLKYAFISHFKAVFSGFWVLDVGLYFLRALRGLCGFCVRERLGGFGACSVFCLSFSSLVLLSCFRLLSCLASCLACFPALCLVFLALWLGFWCWLGCWLSFPFGRLQT